jgi:hypothetical protein
MTPMKILFRVVTLFDSPIELTLLYRVLNEPH